MFWIVKFLISQLVHAVAVIAVAEEWLARLVPFADDSTIPFGPPSIVTNERLLRSRQLQTGWLNFAPASKYTVIGLPLVPEPCTVNVDVIVPHNPTTAPGAIGLPEPQFEAVLKNVAAF